MIFQFTGMFRKCSGSPDKILCLNSSLSYLILITISYPSPNLVFICWELPKHFSLPDTMIPSFVERASASSIEWVVKMTALCFLKVEIFEMICHMNHFAFGSMPVEGSSRNTIGGFPIIAIATESFHLFPPLSFVASMNSYSWRFICSIY